MINKTYKTVEHTNTENVAQLVEKKRTRNAKVVKHDLDSFIKQQKVNWEEQRVAHKKIDDTIICIPAIKEQLNSVEAKIDAIYPRVKQDIDVSQAIETLNKYGKGKAKNWIFWLKLIGIIGGALAVFTSFLTAIKYFFMNK